MRRWLLSRQFPDGQTFAPMLAVIYYDDTDLEVHEALFKLSGVAVQDINARGCIGEIKINSVDILFEISEKCQKSEIKFNPCQLISNKKYDVDIDSIELDVQKQLNDIKNLGLSGFKDYDTYYEMISENIKLYRRLKNLDNLVI